MSAFAKLESDLLRAPSLNFGEGGDDRPEPRSGRAGNGPSAFQFPKWQLERAARIHRMLLALEKKLARGQSLRQALKQPCWFWKSHPYRTAPERTFRLSRPTLIRLLYVWRQHGRTADYLALRYNPRRIHVWPIIAAKFLRASAAPGVTSHAAACRALPVTIRRRFNLRSLLLALPPRTRAALRQLYQARVVARRAEATFNKNNLTTP